MSCAGSAYYSSNPGSVSQIMQVIRLLRGNIIAMSDIVQIRKVSALEGLHHEVGVDHPAVCATLATAPPCLKT